MNAFRIIFEDMGFGDGALFLHRFAFAVAAAADIRNIQKINLRFFVFYGDYIMITVAIGATRGERIIVLKGAAV